MKKQELLNQFISELTKAEGGKSSVSVGNMREIIKLADKQLNGMLYQLIEMRQKALHQSKQTP